MIAYIARVVGKNSKIVFTDVKATEKEAIESIKAYFQRLIHDANNRNIPYAYTEVPDDAIPTVILNKNEIFKGSCTMQDIELNSDGYFPVTSTCRDDLEGLGFDTSEVTDDTMRYLASKLGDDYCEQLYWTSLEITAEYLGIPKKGESQEEDKE